LLQDYLDEIEQDERGRGNGSTEDADTATDVAHDLPVRKGKEDSKVDNTENGLSTTTTTINDERG
jgi:hypothetical protein